jgi:hypothetical protein
MTKLKSAVSAFCVSWLLAATAQAASLQNWTNDVEGRIDAAMKTSSFGSTRDPVSGVVHMKVTLAPDGTIVRAEPAGTASNDLRRAGEQVIKKLGQLPALPGATTEQTVSLLLGFGTSDAQAKTINAQLADAKATSRSTLASR